MGKSLFITISQKQPKVIKKSKKLIFRSIGLDLDRIFEQRNQLQNVQFRSFCVKNSRNRIFWRPFFWSKNRSKSSHLGRKIDFLDFLITLGYFQLILIFFFFRFFGNFLQPKYVFSRFSQNDAIFEGKNQRPDFWSKNGCKSVRKFFFQLFSTFWEMYSICSFSEKKV